MPDECGLNNCMYACGAECSSMCGTYCADTCARECISCSYNCNSECSGCTGTCNNTCRSTCTGQCLGCTACTGSCSAGCDNACTAASMAETIANIGANIIRGNIIKAADFTGLKSAIEKEYQRRSKTAPPAFSPAVTVGNKINLNAIVQVLDDCYNFNSNSANDWRNTVVKGDHVIASKIQPCVTFIKTLATQITVK